MKKLFSVFMTIVFLLIISQQGIVIVHFKLNQKTIEENFCINKNKPELQCHGKCHLNKELQQTQNTGLDSLIIFKKIDLLLLSNFEFRIKKITQIKNKRALSYKELNPPKPYLKIFSPPPLLHFC